MSREPGHGAAFVGWWTDARRQAAAQRAKDWHARENATDPHLIARREAKKKGWPFSALPRRRRQR